MASGSSPSEGENAMFSALLTINTNISTMHNDINNLVVDDGQLDLDSIVTDRRAGDEGKTKTGKAVQAELANIVTGLFKEKLPDDKVQAKLGKYPRPENIKNLKTPRVNP